MDYLFMELLNLW